METTKDQVPQDKVLTLKEIEILKEVPLTDKELQELVEKDEEMYGLHNETLLHSRKRQRELRNKQLIVDQRRIRRKQTETEGENPMKTVNIGKSLVQRMNKQVQEWKDKTLSLPTRKSQEEACAKQGTLTDNWAKVTASDRSVKVKRAHAKDLKARQTRVLFTEVHKNAVLPKKKTKYAAGYDITANGLPVQMLPGHKLTEVSLGWKMLMPKNCFATLALRSGFHKRHPHLTVVGGIIDADYNGQVRLMLMNHGDQDVMLYKGLVFAQVVIAKMPQLEVYERVYDNDEMLPTRQQEDFAERRDWEESKQTSAAAEEDQVPYMQDSQQQRADIYGGDYMDLEEVFDEEMMSDQDLLAAVEEKEETIVRRPAQQGPFCQCDAGQGAVSASDRGPYYDCINCDLPIEGELVEIID
jgi:dUTP pyrophosphatase